MRVTLVACLSAIGLLGGSCSLKELAKDPRCYTDADCFDGKVCSNNLCWAPAGVPPTYKCWASRDCSTSSDGQKFVCSIFTDYTTRCLPEGNGEQHASCAADFQCKKGLRCQLYGLGGECVAEGTKTMGGSCQASVDCIGGLVCAPDHTCQPLFTAFPHSSGVTCPPDSGAFRAYFEVPRAGTTPADFLRLPFPSDARVGASGELDLSDFPRPGPTPVGVDLVGLYVDALVQDFDGWSAVAPVQFRFSAPADPTTLAGNVILVDVTAGATLGQAIPVETHYYPSAQYYTCANRLAVSHGAADVLRPAHTYAAVLSTSIKSQGGAAPATDPDLAAMLDASPPADMALATAWQAHAALRAWLQSSGRAPSTVAGVAVFKVADVAARLARLRTAVLAQPAPVFKDVTVCDGQNKSPCDDGTSQRACGTPVAGFTEVHGRMSVPIFQQGTAPYLTPADGGGIVEQGGVPMVQRSEDVCVALSIPKAAAPGAGWPLVVYHHGTGGSMRSFIDEGIAAHLASAGQPMAVLGFDAVEHGARRGGSPISPDNLVFNVLNPRAARDNFVQGAADITQALRAAAATITVAGNPVRFDGAHRAFFGHSQGSTSGPLALASDSQVGAAVLSGAGAGLTTSLLTKTSPVDVAQGMEFLLGEKLDAQHLVLHLFQTYLDRSDPLAITPLLVRRPPSGVPAKHLWQSYGVGDTYSTPPTLVNMAAGLGLPVVAPIDVVALPTAARPVTANLVAGDGRMVTGALFQYRPNGYDGHFVALQNPAAAVDWLAFLSSWLATGTPVVP